MLVGAVLVLCFPQTGKLQLYDLASGNLLETIDAHDGALWASSLSPDQVTKPALARVFGTPAAFAAACVGIHYLLLAVPRAVCRESPLSVCSRGFLQGGLSRARSSR